MLSLINFSEANLVSVSLRSLVYQSIMKTWEADNEDEVINSIDASDPSSIVIGTFRPYSSCTVYIVSHNETLHRLNHNFSIADAKLSTADPKILITVSDYIRVWNVDSGHLTAVLSPHQSEIPELCPFTAVSFAPDSSVFAVVDIRGFCSVWDVNKKDPIEVFEICSEKLYGVSFVNDNVIGCVGESGSLYVLDRSNHHVVCSQGIEAVPRCQPVKLAWLPNLSLVAIAYQISGCVSVYELTTASGSPRLLGTTKAGDSIADICWLNQFPEYLVVARDSGAVEVWSKNNLSAPHFDFMSQTPVSSVRGTANGVLVGTVKGEVVFSDLPNILSRSEVVPFTKSTNPVSYPALA